MTWNIVCDSSCDLRAGELHGEGVGLIPIPMRLLIGGQDYTDDAALSVPELLIAMKQEKTAASSACPSPAAFAEAFAQADCTVCFTISANLSGTYNAAMLGRDMAMEEHPEKHICVIDSKSTAGAMVLLARRAKDLIEGDGGEDYERVFQDLRIYQASLRTVFTLENFDNLIKNGRMRPLVGNLLHSLGIHVIADATAQGTIHVADKARGEVKTYRAMTTLMAASKDCTGADVVISHCENLMGAIKLKQQILAELPVKSVDILACKGLTSFYAMEKGLIVGY